MKASVNKSLLARTCPEFYDEYAATACEMGVSDEDIAGAVTEAIRIAESLCEGKCPKCGAPIARYVDYERQQGVCAIPGAWVQYRCSTAPPPGTPRGDACDFMVDFKEGEAGN